VTFTVTIGGWGSGRVTSDPQGIDCPGTCAMDVPEGTRVTLSQQPSADSVFGGWGGFCFGTTSCVLAAEPRTYSASFDPAVPAGIRIAQGPIVWSEISGDGKNVLFSDGDEWPRGHCEMTYDGGARVFVASTSGTPPVQLPTAAEATFSASGARLALLVPAFECGDSGDVYVAAGDGSGLSKVALGVDSFGFSGDNLYLRRGDEVWYVAPDGTETHIEVPPSSFAPNPRDAGLQPYLILPDLTGQAVAYCPSQPWADGPQHCFFRPAGSTTAIALPDAVWPLNWTPDSSWLIAGSSVYSRDGKVRRTLPSACTQPILNAAGDTLVFAGGTGAQRQATGNCDGTVVLFPLSGATPRILRGLPPTTAQQAQWSLSLEGGETVVLATMKTYDGSGHSLMQMFEANVAGGFLPMGDPTLETPFDVLADGRLIVPDLTRTMLGGSKCPLWSAPLLRESVGQAAAPFVPFAIGVPVVEAAGPHALAVTAGCTADGVGGELHLLQQGEAWPGQVIPGFQSSGASVLTYAGRSLVFSGPSRPAAAEAGVVFDLASVHDDGSSLMHIASTVHSVLVQGTSLFVVQGADSSLWRIDVPQP
jgi:hypothetical protein